jgi:hypothetical protein
MAPIKELRDQRTLVSMEQRPSRRVEAAIPENPTNLPLRLRVAMKLRGLRRLFGDIDDFDWSTYHVHYRSEVAVINQRWADNLADVDFRVIDGRLYLLADSKPLHPTHRCLYEALLNLPAIDSVAEVGAGGGRNIVNVRELLGSGRAYSAFDLSQQQLDFFASQYPEPFSAMRTGLLDLTAASIDERSRPDAVFASTVLMHIQRPAAYLQALDHFLSSARKYAVLMDNYNSHDYFRDLSERSGRFDLYCYDSGSSLAIVVDLARQGLPAPYAPLTASAQLGRYLPDYRWR